MFMSTLQQVRWNIRPAVARFKSISIDGLSSRRVLSTRASSNAVSEDKRVDNSDSNGVELLQSGSGTQAPATSSSAGISKTKRLFWTEQEHELLLRERLRTDSVQDIQKTHFPDRSVRSLNSRLYLLRMRSSASLPRSWSSAETERVLELHGEGLSAQAIAARIGRPWTDVQELMKIVRFTQPQDSRLKRIRGGSRLTEQVVESIRVLCLDGKTVQEIAKATDTSETTVRRQCRAFGLRVASSEGARMRWIADEKARLKPFLLRELSREKAFELFPLRSAEGVASILNNLRKAAHMGPQYVRRPQRLWTSKDDEVLRPYIMQKRPPLADLAKKLDRTEMSILARTYKLRRGLSQTVDTTDIAMQAVQGAEEQP